MNEAINIRDRNRGAVSKSSASLFFYGDEGNPFLAPRGVHTAGGKLIVADTAQNRIFIWNRMPAFPYKRPSTWRSVNKTTNDYTGQGPVDGLIYLVIFGAAALPACYWPPVYSVFPFPKRS